MFNKTFKHARIMAKTLLGTLPKNKSRKSKKSVTRKSKGGKK